MLRWADPPRPRPEPNAPPRGPASRTTHTATNQHRRSPRCRGICLHNGTSVWQQRGGHRRSGPRRLVHLGLVHLGLLLAVRHSSSSTTAACGLVRRGGRSPIPTFPTTTRSGPPLRSAVAGSAPVASRNPRMQGTRRARLSRRARFHVRRGRAHPGKARPTLYRHRSPQRNRVITVRADIRSPRWQRVVDARCCRRADPTSATYARPRPGPPPSMLHVPLPRVRGARPLHAPKTPAAAGGVFRPWPEARRSRAGAGLSTRLRSASIRTRPRSRAGGRAGGGSRSRRCWSAWS